MSKKTIKRDIFKHGLVFLNIEHTGGKKGKAQIIAQDHNRIMAISSFAKKVGKNTLEILCKDYLRLFSIPYKGISYFQVPNKLHVSDFESALKNYESSQGKEHAKSSVLPSPNKLTDVELLKDTTSKEREKHQGIVSTILEWQAALREEVSFLKKQGGSLYMVVNGRFLYNNSGSSIYVFTLISELFFPDGTPVRIEVGNKSALGEVLSVEGFEIELRLDQFIGNEIKEAKMFSEPWQLLVELSNRLDEVKPYHLKRGRVAALLKGTAPAKHEEKLTKKEKELLFRSYYNRTTYIWGPPGTGKTYNLSRIVAQHHVKGKKVLVMAHSNAAVDVLMHEVAKVLEKSNKWVEGEVIRYGYSNDQEILSHPSLLTAKLVEYKHPQLFIEKREIESRRKQLKSMVLAKGKTKEFEKELAELDKVLKQLKVNIKELEKGCLQEAKIVGATLSKCAMDPLLHRGSFDLVVVDEVSMAYVPQLALAASLGKRIVVCGDFKQLPPIALSDHELVEKWLREDIFHHAGIVAAVKGGNKHPNLFMLKEQRRMHPHISSFTNSVIYNDKVYDHKDSNERNEIARQYPYPGKATMLVDLSKMGAFALTDVSSHSRFNIMSGLISVQLALLAVQNNLDSVGVITPYKVQARFVSTCVQEIMDKKDVDKRKAITVATVHKFQGSERDAIVFDVVDSYPQKKPSVLLTDKNSSRLVNVAVTRARGKFIQVIDTHYGKSRYGKQLAITSLTNHIYDQFHIDTRYEHYDQFLSASIGKNLQWFANRNPVDPGSLYEDLKKAKKSIVLSVPDPTKIDRRIWKEINALSKKFNVTVYTNTEVKAVKTLRIVPLNLVVNFIIIDDEVLWIGSPIVTGTGFESEALPPYITGRLHAPNTISLLKGFMGIDEKGNWKRR